jgi:diguanylate cyclase (GGDEF)-like protein
LKLRATQLPDLLSQTPRWAIVAAFAIGLILLYAPPAIYILITGQDAPSVVEHAIILIGALIFTFVPVWVARARISLLSDSQRLRVRESRGWYVIAVAGLLMFASRGIYAWYDLVLASPDSHVPSAYALTRASYFLLFLGLVILPWSVKRLRPGSTLLSMAIVVVATGTLFWPILIGPVLAGEIEGRVGTIQLSSHLGLISLLTMAMLWIVLSHLREELLPTAIAFLSAIAFQIFVQAGLLAMLVSQFSSTAESLGSLLVHGGMTASFLLIGLAGILRIGSMNGEPDTSTSDELGRDLGTIPSWQMIMPYPILITLVVVRVSMELFNWQEQYRSAMVYGISMVVVLIMIWQLPMLRYNQALHDRLAQSAIRDGLTGVYTHRVLHDLLDVEVSRASRAGHSLAVLFLDIDHFKTFNDRYGHKIGDRVLQRVASTVRAQVRAGDFVGRYGGEEFMVIAPDAGPADAARFAERLRAEIESGSMTAGLAELPVTVSVGVTCFPADGATATELIERADQLMYQAKQQGRNSVVCYAEIQTDVAIGEHQAVG